MSIIFHLKIDLMRELVKNHNSNDLLNDSLKHEGGITMSFGKSLINKELEPYWPFKPEKTLKISPHI